MVKIEMLRRDYCAVGCVRCQLHCRKPCLTRARSGVATARANVKQEALNRVRNIPLFTCAYVKHTDAYYPGDVRRKLRRIALLVWRKHYRDTSMMIPSSILLVITTAFSLVQGKPTHGSQSDLTGRDILAVIDLSSTLNQRPDPCPQSSNADAIAQISKPRDVSPLGMSTPTILPPPTAVYATPSSTVSASSSCDLIAKFRFNDMWASEARTRPVSADARVNYDVQYEFTTPLDRIEVWARDDSSWSREYELFLTHEIGGPGLSGYMVFHMSRKAHFYLRIVMREGDVKGSLALSKLIIHRPPGVPMVDAGEVVD